MAGSEKQERAGSKAIFAFFQPFEFRAVVGLETVLDVIRQTPLMQCGTANPAHRDAGLPDRIRRQPNIADRDEAVA